MKVIESQLHADLNFSGVYLKNRANNAVDCLFSVSEISLAVKTVHSGLYLLHIKFITSALRAV